MTIYSPWGSIQHIQTFDTGFVSVSTASHGGFMLHKEFAESRLSSSALKHGEQYNGWYCYEEDCEWAIPTWELLDKYGNMIFRDSIEYDTREKQRKLIYETLSAWNPEYLIDVFVIPDPILFQNHLNRLKENEMRKNNDPNLIVCAWGSWDTKIKGTVRVLCADERQYIVTESSYEKRGTPNLLSNCVILNEIKQEQRVI